MFAQGMWSNLCRKWQVASRVTFSGESDTKLRIKPVEAGHDHAAFAGGIKQQGALYVNKLKSQTCNKIN